MSEKPSINIAVLGHENSGKSSLIGQLLLSLGKVDDEYWDRIAQDCQDADKDYTEPAWLCDTLEDERERNCSTDITTRMVETEKYKLVLTDVPGRREYVKSAIVGLCGADIALAVVSATEEEFGENYKREGQLREHCYLAGFMGVKTLVVAINKMDLCGWSEQRFDDLDYELGRFVLRAGFHKDLVKRIPVSALQQENITTAPENASWYHGLTLIEALENLPRRTMIERRSSGKPLRVAIQVVRQVPSVGTVAYGMVASGTLTLGMSVTVFPTGDTFEIYSLESFGEAIDEATPGMMVAFTPSDDSVELRRGHVVSAAGDPAVGCKSFIASVISYHPGRIHNGYTPIVHCGTARVPCRIELLQRADMRTGRMFEEKPEELRRREGALVRMVPTKPMYVGDPSLFRTLIIRDNGSTVGLGRLYKIEEFA